MTAVLVLLGAAAVGAVVFGVVSLVTGADPGLALAVPDGVAESLPASRPLVESDVANVRFDVAFRGYRIAQVDAVIRRAAYDIGYKDELVAVLEAELRALREGRHEEAESLRRTRLAALSAGEQAASVDAPRGDVASVDAPRLDVARVDVARVDVAEPERDDSARPENRT